MTNIGILGSGIVAKTLAKGFLKRGDKVMLGTRDINKLEEWRKTEGDNILAGSFSEAAEFGDILILAVSGKVAVEVLESVNNINGKTIIDVTNPIADNPPHDGVLSFFTTSDESLMEILQEKYPEANFVKAFNSVGSAYMVNPEFDVKPTMFICGNNEKAKSAVSEILDDFGWEVEDMGKATAARAIEQLCILWCIPGFINNSWNHAFKLLKKV